MKKQFKQNHNQIVVVEWYDAAVEGDWKPDAKCDIHKCTTAGFVVDESNTAICIASTLSGNQSNARISIPKAWIAKRKTINLTQPKKEKQNVGSSNTPPKPVIATE